MSHGLPRRQRTIGPTKARLVPGVTFCVMAVVGLATRAGAAPAADISAAAAPVVVAPSLVGLVTDFGFRDPTDDDWALVARSGATWVREGLRWDRLGGADGPFNWTQPRSVVTTARARGLSVLGELGFGPNGWVPGRTYTYVPAPPGPAAVRQWQGYVGSAGRALAGSVTAWEVWPGANDSAYWRPRPDVDDYMTLLRAAHGALLASGALVPATEVDQGGRGERGGADGPRWDPSGTGAAPGSPGGIEAGPADSGASEAGRWDSGSIETGRGDTSGSGAARGDTSGSGAARGDTSGSGAARGATGELGSVGAALEIGRPSTAHPGREVAHLVLGGAEGVHIERDDGFATVIDGVRWIEAVLDRGGGSLVDAVAVRPEGDSPEQVVALVDDVRAVLAARPDAPRQVWVTDVGWSLQSLALPADATGVSPEALQAAWLARTMVAFASQPDIAAVFWRGLWSRGPAGDFALVGVDGVPRPALLAMRTVAEQLGGATFRSGTPVGGWDTVAANGHRAVELHFDRADGKTTVVWRPASDGGRTPVALTGLPVTRTTVVTLDGQERAADVVAGTLQIEATFAPVFVRYGADPRHTPARRLELALTRVQDVLRTEPWRMGSDLAAWLDRAAVQAAQGAGASPTAYGEASEPSPVVREAALPPTEAARQLLFAVGRHDAASAARALPAGRMPIGRLAMQAGLGAVTALGARLDPSDLRYDAIEQDADTAIVRVTGTLRVTQRRFGRRDTTKLPVHFHLHLARDGDAWRVVDARRPSATEVSPTALGLHALRPGVTDAPPAALGLHALRSGATPP